MQNKDGDTALIRAVIEFQDILNDFVNVQIHSTVNKIEVVRLLLRNTNINANVQNNIGDTALICAVKTGNKEIVTLLLQNKNIAVNIKNHYGNTALLCSAKKVSELLLQKSNTAVNIKNLNGIYALNEFADSIDIILQLLSRGDIDMNINIQNYSIFTNQDLTNGNNILHYAVYYKSCDINLIKNIIRLCPSCLNIRNYVNKLPLDVAFENDLSIEVIATLLLNTSTSTSSLSLFSYSSKYSSHPVYSKLDELLQSTSYDSVIRLHLCGFEGAGKTTLRHCINASLAKIFSIDSNLNRSSPITIGMDITSFTDSRVKYVVYDYGGQTEYHVNHSRFLRSNSSIYVIVLNLCQFRDLQGNNLQPPVPLKLEELSDLSSKYTYWLKFINVATSTSSIDENARKGHVITCFNCDRSFIKTGHLIIESAISTISQAQNEWINSSLTQNHIKFVNVGKGIPVVNMNSTASIRKSFMPLLRVNINEIAAVSTNNFKLVEEILYMRGNENRFDIGPRKVCIDLIMNTFPTTFPNGIKNGLAEAALTQLELIGEVMLFENNKIQLIVTNSNKLTSVILGKLANYLNQKKKSNIFVDFKAYSISRSEVLSQIDSSIKCCEGVGVEVIIDLLEILGVCIKCNVDTWFPVFAADNGNVQETYIFELAPDLRKYSRRIHRRYKLSNSKAQMFPLGYFSSLFVYVSSMATIEGNFQLFSNSILIPESGRVGGDIDLPHMETIIIISEDRSYFDVIVQSWVDVEPLDNTGLSRYWNRLHDIKYLIYNDPKFINNYVVDIEECMIHPDPKNQSEKQVSVINNSDSDIASFHDLWPWIFGMNGNKYGISHPQSIKIKQKTVIDNMDFFNRIEAVDSRIEHFHHHVTAVDHHVKDINRHVIDVDNQVNLVKQHLKDVNQNIRDVDQHVTELEHHVRDVNQHIAEVNQHAVMVDNHVTYLDHYVVDGFNIITDLIDQSFKRDEERNEIINHLSNQITKPTSSSKRSGPIGSSR